MYNKLHFYRRSESAQPSSKCAVEEQPPATMSTSTTTSAPRSPPSSSMATVSGFTSLSVQVGWFGMKTCIKGPYSIAGNVFFSQR